VVSLFASQLSLYFLPFPYSLSLFCILSSLLSFCVYFSRLVISSSYFVPSFSPYFILPPFGVGIAQWVQWLSCRLERPKEWVFDSRWR
jgi:hypothetical protein